MGAPLFPATKFTPPRLPRTHVRRPDLAVRIERSATPMTLVVGPPGSGKSVLLTEWSAHTTVRYSWMECDELDQDPYRFWQALLTSLGAAEPDEVDWLDLVELAGETPPVEDVVASTVNTLVRSRMQAIVVDDAHLASDAMPSLGKLVEALPDGVRVIVSSRTEPRLPLHRLRARGQLDEVRQRDLSFSPSEASELIARFDVELDPDETAELVARTDGWAAGLQLASLALHDRVNDAHLLDALAASRRSINEFLLEEALEQQTDAVRTFLLDISILDEFDDETCSALVERSSGLLSQVEAANLFLIDLDGTGRRFRFHHLFGDLLRFESKATDPERQRDLHRRAATLFGDRGDIAAALRHLNAAGDTDAAWALYTESVHAGFFREGAPALRRWLDNLDEQTRHQPERIRVSAFAHAMVGDLDRADRLLSEAERAIPVDPSTDERVHMTRAVIEMFRGEPQLAERAITAALAVGASTEMVATAPGFLARTRLWIAGPDAAHQVVATRGLSPVEHSGYEDMTLTAAEAWTYAVAGDLRDAERLANQALAAGTGHGHDDHPALSDAFRALGVVAYERGELDAAETHLERSLRSSDDRPAWLLLGELALSRVWVAWNRPGDALELARQARSRLDSNSSSTLVDLADSSIARSLLAAGDTGGAADLVNGLRAGARKDRYLAKVALRANDLDAASAAVRRLSPTTTREHVDLGLLEARLALARRDESDELRPALEAVQRAGFTQILANQPAPLREATRRLLRARRRDPWSTAVLALLDARPADDLPAPPAHAGAYEPLSDRELTILRHLASRLTNQEIAAELYLSVNTVKTHVKGIYRKLGASSRSEALATARRLGLI